MAAAIVDHLSTTWKLFAEALLAPRGDHLEIGREGRRRQLEAHLIIPLPCGTMGNGISPLRACDLHHALGDEWTRDAGSKKVLPLVHGSRLHHREDEVAGKLGLQIIDIALRSTRAQSLGLESLQLLFLTDVCAEGDDFRGVGLLDPVQNNGGVQTPGVGNDDFHEPVGYSIPRLVARRFEKRVG